jgi:hypothetical protein
VVDLGSDPVREGVPVAEAGAPPGQLPQVGHLVVAGRARERREVGGDELEVEGALAPQRRRPGDRSRVAGEAAGLLVARAQVGPGGGGEPAVDLVE